MPRYHTNLKPIISALLIKYDVKILVFSPTRKEQMSHCIELIDLSVIQNGIEYFRSFLSEYNPDIAIVRWDADMKNLTRMVKLLYKINTNVIAYDQLPKYIGFNYKQIVTELISLINRLKNNLSIGIITPISHYFNNKRINILYRKHFKYPFLKEEREEYFKRGKINILMVGKFRQSLKRHDWVINSLSKVNNKVKLKIVGEYPELEKIISEKEINYIRKLHHLINDSNIEIEMHKNVEHKYMMEYYKNADVFLMPSENETLGISVLEAMANGCAVLSSDSVGVACYIKHGENGLLFRNNDYLDFNSKLHRLISDRSFILRLGVNAQEYISKNHNYENFLAVLKNN